MANPQKATTTRARAKVNGRRRALRRAVDRLRPPPGRARRNLSSAVVLGIVPPYYSKVPRREDGGNGKDERPDRGGRAVVVPGECIGVAEQCEGLRCVGWPAGRQEKHDCQRGPKRPDGHQEDQRPGDLTQARQRDVPDDLCAVGTVDPSRLILL